MTRPAKRFVWLAASAAAVAGLGIYSGGFTLRVLPVGDGSVTGITGGEAPAATPDSLRRALSGLAPRGTYLVVDRANNRLWVRTADTVRLEAVVSTGSGTVLRETGGLARTWVFDTPAGEHRVLAERPDPVWVKPDWAFLEEGLPPPRSRHERLETGSLGEWALDLGDGYMIHGTLYERLLGRSITHGCIRVGRDDLRAVVKAARPGTPVFVF
jgi:L,D-transpeptidase YbiS